MSASDDGSDSSAPDDSSPLPVVADPIVETNASTDAKPVSKKRSRPKSSDQMSNKRRLDVSPSEEVRKVKVERGDGDVDNEVFSWPTEVAKTLLMGGLALVGVYVQQRFSQPRSVVCAVEPPPPPPPVVKPPKKAVIRHQVTLTGATHDGDPFADVREARN